MTRSSSVASACASTSALRTPRTDPSNRPSGLFREPLRRAVTCTESNSFDASSNDRASLAARSLRPIRTSGLSPASRSTTSCVGRPAVVFSAANSRAASRALWRSDSRRRTTRSRSSSTSDRAAASDAASADRCNSTWAMFTYAQSTARARQPSNTVSDTTTAIVMLPRRRRSASRQSVRLRVMVSETSWQVAARRWFECRRWSGWRRRCSTDCRRCSTGCRRHRRCSTCRQCCRGVARRAGLSPT